MSLPVQFVSLTQEEYNDISVKESSKLYFTQDTNRIYKGNVLYSTSYGEKINTNLQLIKPQNEQSLHIKIYISEKPDFSTLISGLNPIDSTVPSNFKYFKALQTSNAVKWSSIDSNGFGVQFNNKPITFDLPTWFKDNQYNYIEKEILFVKYYWFYYDEDDIEIRSDEYSIILPSITEVGANSNDSIGKREFQELEQNVIVENYLVPYDDYLQGSYKCHSTKYNMLQNDIQDQDTIILGKYNEHKTYKMKFKVNDDEDASVKFYKELDDGSCVLDEILTSDTYKFVKSNTYCLTICDKHIRITNDDVYQDIGGNVGKLLNGKSYDFSNNESIYKSLKDILEALGAIANNVPTKQLNV